MIAAILFFQSAAAVHLDYNWLEYCARTKDPGCIVETITPRDLALINMVVTEGIRTVENDSPDDPWEAFPASRAGDCDDRAATTRQALLALGVDPKAMRFQTGQVTEPDGRKLGHIVLLVTLDGKTWVLDSKTPGTIWTPEKRPYAWAESATEGQAVIWSTK